MATVLLLALAALGWRVASLGPPSPFDPGLRILAAALAVLTLLRFVLCACCGADRDRP